MGVTCLLDTTIFCNMLRVPGRDQDASQVFDELERNLQEGWAFVLPLAVVVETGNHVAQVADGRVRREVAMRFSKEVRGAVEGSAPWVTTSLWNEDDVKNWLQEFPESAMRGESFADMSIIAEFKRLVAAAPHHRIVIWSLDRHLKGYDSKPHPR